MPRARDYYRVEDEHGHRYWIFREGLYDDGRGSHPDWFMQGLLA
jgi:protein ImuB